MRLVTLDGHDSSFSKWSHGFKRSFAQWRHAVYQNGCISWDINPCHAIHQSMLRVPPDPRVCRFERDLWRASRLTSTWRVDSSALTCECLNLAKVISILIFVCGCQPFFLVSFCSNSVSLKACQLSGVPQKAKPCVVVAGDGKIFACGQEVFPCSRRGGTYLASWPNVALAGAFHADGQRDRDDSDRGKPT